MDLRLFYFHVMICHISICIKNLCILVMSRTRFRVNPHSIVAYYRALPVNISKFSKQLGNLEISRNEMDFGIIIFWLHHMSV